MRIRSLLHLKAAVAGLLHFLSGTRVVVAGSSMEPALAAGDKLLISWIANRGPWFPQRGQIVLLCGAACGRPESVKRVVGLPRDRLRTVANRVMIDGKTLPERYLAATVTGAVFEGGMLAEVQDTGAGREWILGPHEYFVLGDNRPHSTDSRAFGPVRRDEIIGIAWYRYAPPQRRGRLGELPAISCRKSGHARR